MKNLSGIVADATGVKQKRGAKGELRAVIGIHAGRAGRAFGMFYEYRLAGSGADGPGASSGIRTYKIPFIYDGEPGLDDFLTDVAEAQRCTWHGPRGLYHAL